jgi:hypothetical protein
MKRFTLVGAATVCALALSFTGLAGTAHADTASDVQKVLGNLGPATDALVDGVQAALNDALATHSAVTVSADLGQALVDAGSALVAGTEQFGALGLGFSLLNGGVQAVLAPYLGAIDHPETAGDVVSGLAADLPTLLGHLSAAVDGILHGGGNDDGLAAGLAEALRGNLTGGPGFGAVAPGALTGDAINGLGTGLTTLLAGTSLENLTIPVAVVLLVAAIGGGDYLQQLEDALAPVFSAIGPVTEPIAVAVSGL